MLVVYEKLTAYLSFVPFARFFRNSQATKHFKIQFRHLIFYAIPFTILFIVRKRLNFLIVIGIAFAVSLYTLL